VLFRSEKAELDASLTRAAEAAKAAGANHVTVYSGDCPQAAKGREAVHPLAVEKAYSIINRYPNVPYSTEIAQAHFVIDRSGYVRARFKAFGADDGSATQFAGLASMLASEPLVEINLHSH
jgi:putative copper resistance protein D